MCVSVIAADTVDLQHMGARLTMPGLVVHDEGDDSVPFSEAVALVDGWPRARLLRTQGLGHRKVLGDADVVASVADFVSGAPTLHVAS